MEERRAARIAVAAATYAIDKPYSYLVPEELRDTCVPGARVTVPFGRANKRSEGIVLEVRSAEGETEKLKTVDSVLDKEPPLTADQLQLALFMRDRFFCTVYDAVRAMLPAGMWFDTSGRRRVGERTARYAILAVPAEDAAALAEQKRAKAPHQSELLRVLCSLGEAPCADLTEFTGAPTASLTALRKQGIIEIETRELALEPEEDREPTADRIVLNAEQQRSFEGLVSLMNSPDPAAALLYGVTGSGKTAVYVSLAHEAVNRGRTAMVLVPEIGLTPQFLNIFMAHFGSRVAVMHSSLSPRDRLRQWKRIKAGQVSVVVGTRSAVFAPLADVGLIVIDEEQEHTYKSENAPRYSTRDVAKYIVAKSGGLLVLGSATPSVESMYAAKCGKYSYFELTTRYNERPLPRVIIANMRSELRSGNGGLYSAVLRREMEENLRSGEQTILFLNHRGASSCVLCGECGYTFQCPNCSVSLTYHSVDRRLRCHYCGFSVPVPRDCPDCGGRLKFVGAGTQKAEEELLGLFPEAKVLRMDADTVSRIGSHEKILETFRTKRVPFLIGTQMVTKGLDFENVTLVGVLSADRAIYAGDYRSGERAFSLITQVVGRSGRGRKAGRAVIQTYTPENELITLAARQDYPGFYQREIELRRLMEAPPFCDLLAVTVSGGDENLVLKGCLGLLEALRSYFGPEDGLRILGPAPAGVAKVNNRYRYRLTLAGANSRRVRDRVSYVITEFSKDKKYRGLAVFADSEPPE